MCCAWIVRALMKAGYAPEDDRTVEMVERWRDAPPDACINGRSAGYLRRSGQIKDLEFILSHINDLDAAYLFKNDEVIEVTYESAPIERAMSSLSSAAAR